MPEDVKDIKRTTISACMIVKDEEEMLPDCLQSIELWCDEIVIVDTGSTDKTLEIIKAKVAKDPEKYKLYHQEWKYDFSFHRNYSMAQATKEWQFVIDADERVIEGHGPQAKGLLAKTTAEAVLVDLLNTYGPNHRVKAHVPTMRFFRRSKGFKYANRVHNSPVLKPDTIVARIAMGMIHLGFGMEDERMQTKKYDRRLKMCEELIKDQPDEPVSYFHIVRALKVKKGAFNVEDAPRMEKYLDKLFKCAGGHNDPQNTYLQSLNLAAWIYLAQSKNKKASSYALRALSIKPDYLDSMLAAGAALAFGVDAEQGKRWLLRYLREQEIYDPNRSDLSVVMEHVSDRAYAYRLLADIEDWKTNSKSLKPQEK